SRAQRKPQPLEGRLFEDSDRKAAGLHDASRSRRGQVDWPRVTTTDVPKLGRVQVQDAVEECEILLVLGPPGKGGIEPCCDLRWAASSRPLASFRRSPRRSSSFSARLRSVRSCQTTTIAGPPSISTALIATSTGTSLPSSRRWTHSKR